MMYEKLHQKKIKYKQEDTKTRRFLLFFAPFAAILCAFAVKFSFFGEGRGWFLTQGRKDFTQRTQSLRAFLSSCLRVKNKYEVQSGIHPPVCPVPLVCLVIFFITFAK